MTLANRLRWFLGRLIAPVRTLGTGAVPIPPAPEVDPEADADEEPDER